MVTGQSFDHRKQWLVERMHLLAAVFAVDICAYAAMSNHFHLVLRLAPERARAWDDDEVLERLAVVFAPAAKALREMSAGDRTRALAVWRERLGDLSWFMRCLNEWIARRANNASFPPASSLPRPSVPPTSIPTITRDRAVGLTTRG